MCGGLGRYFGLDPVIIRLAAVALTFAGGAGIIAYAGAWLLVPEEGTDAPLLKGSPNNRKIAMIAGIVLVALGAIGILDSLNFWFDSDLLLGAARDRRGRLPAAALHRSRQALRRDAAAGRARRRRGRATRQRRARPRRARPHRPRSCRPAPPARPP